MFQLQIQRNIKIKYYNLKNRKKLLNCIQVMMMFINLKEE